MSSSVPSDFHHTPYLPRWALIAAGVLVAGSLTLATVSRLMAPPPAMPAATGPSTALRFSQLQDNALIVTNAASGAVVARLAPSADAFLRTTLRTMIETRDHDRLSRSAPFLLIPGARDSIVLYDPTTGERIDLQAFGPSNEAQFKALMVKTGGQP